MSVLALDGAAAAGCSRRRPRGLRRPRLLRLPPSKLRRICGRELAMVFQDPDDLLAPDAVDRDAAHRARAPASRPRTESRRASWRSMPCARYGSPTGEHAPRIPAPVLRRDATTDRDRDRARLPAEAPGRRRAHDRARRDGSGRDHPAARPPSYESGLTIVLITHDLGVLSSIADRVAIFYAGRVVEAGLPTEVLGHPRHPYTRGLLDACPTRKLPRHRSSRSRARRRRRVTFRPAARSIRAVGTHDLRARKRSRRSSR